jgi:hypothetical protein
VVPSGTASRQEGRCLPPRATAHAGGERAQDRGEERGRASTAKTAKARSAKQSKSAAAKKSAAKKSAAKKAPKKKDR